MSVAESSSTWGRGFANASRGLGLGDGRPGGAGRDREEIRGVNRV